MSRTLASCVVGVLVGMLVAHAPAPARADAVGPPPASCPPGSTPQSSHAGPLCVPMAECTSSTACSGGASCESVSQCIETRECGGRRPPDSGPCTVEHVVGACGAGDACSVGVCRARRVCTTAPSSSDGGCGCRAAGASPGEPSLALAALALVGLVLAARRRA